MMIGDNTPGETPEKSTEEALGKGNLMRPWEPGQSGNPDGRPKGSKDGLQAKVRRLLRTRASSEVKAILDKYGYSVDDPTYADAISIVTVYQALQGDIAAIKLLKEMDEDEAQTPQEGKVTINILSVSSKPEANSLQPKILVNGNDQEHRKNTEY